MTPAAETMSFMFPHVPPSAADRKALKMTAARRCLWMNSWRLLCLVSGGIRYLVSADGTNHPRCGKNGREVAIMGWTDERVEMLKKLWLDGHSASQIAKQLGGVTRNAVIGKVHRLGLSGRATPSSPPRPAFKAPRAPRPVSN